MSLKITFLFLICISLFQNAPVLASEDEETRQAIEEAMSFENRYSHLGIRADIDAILDEQEKEQQARSFNQSGYLDSSSEVTARNPYFVPFHMEGSDWVKASIAAGAAVVFFANDEEVMKFAQENQTEVTETIAFWGERWGAGTEAVLSSAAGYVIGVVVKNNKIRSYSLMALKSMTYAGLVTRAIKTTMRRVRPNKDEENAHDWYGSLDDHSFPSGHTTLAFSVGTLIAESTNGKSKVIPILAYSASAIAGWSRVHDKAHWASDVVVGALIGHLVTKNIMKQSPDRQGGFLFTPYVDASGNVMFGLQYVGKKPKKKSNCNKAPNPIRACLLEGFHKSGAFN